MLHVHMLRFIFISVVHAALAMVSKKSANKVIIFFINSASLSILLNENFLSIINNPLICHCPISHRIKEVTIPFMGPLKVWAGRHLAL